MKNTESVRLNIRVPAYIQEWYKEQAELYSIPYTTYMSMTLIERYKIETEKELAKNLNDTMQSLKGMTDGSMSAENMLREMQIIMKDVEKLDKKNN